MGGFSPVRLFSAGGQQGGGHERLSFFLTSVSQSQSGSCIPPSEIPSAMVNLPVAGLLTL